MRLRNVLLCQLYFILENQVTVAPWLKPPFAGPADPHGLDTPLDLRMLGKVANLLKARFRLGPIAGKISKEMRFGHHLSPLGSNGGNDSDILRLGGLWRLVLPYTWRWTSTPTTMASDTRVSKVIHPQRQGDSWPSSHASSNNSYKTPTRPHDGYRGPFGPC